MKVLVIGAAGKTGTAVVQQAVAAGHQVTAPVRNADEYQVPNVRVVEGDARDRSAMDAAMLGQDAVIDTSLGCALGNLILASQAAGMVPKLPLPRWALTSSPRI